MSHNNIAIFIPHQGCPHACSFCDQKRISGQSKPVTPADVQAELQRAFERPLDGSRTEIAFFGGSFTCLPPSEMEAFLQVAAPYVKQGRAAGIRVSTRPDGISPDILELLRSYGVSAIELGAQSMNDDVLRLNRRGHTAGQVAEASRLIRQYGFSLGLQMMVGLYGDRKESLYRTAEEIIALQPDTVRIYPTVVLAGTMLDELRKQGLYSPLTLPRAVALCAPLLQRFEQHKIRVIRMGLHPSKEVERFRTGGAYHPAFRELCESRLKRQQLENILIDVPQESSVTLWVTPSELSKTIGQRKENIRWAEQRGYTVSVLPDQTLAAGEMRAEWSPIH